MSFEVHPVPLLLPMCKAALAARKRVNLYVDDCSFAANAFSSAGGGALPPVATLLRGSADMAASSAAQRLARKTGRSVALAWALPEQPPMLAILAERSIVEGLADMSLVQRGE